MFKSRNSRFRRRGKRKLFRFYVINVVSRYYVDWLVLERNERERTTTMTKKADSIKRETVQDLFSPIVATVSNFSGFVQIV